MKNSLWFIFFSLLFFSCVDASQELEDGYIPCSTSTTNYFEPTNKTFIPPTKSDFLEKLCYPLVLDSDVEYYDLTATRVCLLEQHLGHVIDSIQLDLCNQGVTIDTLDEYLRTNYFLTKQNPPQNSTTQESLS